MSARRGLLIALAVVVVAGLGVGGYALGSAQAPDEAEATAEREAAYQAAYDSSLEDAAERSRERGLEEGQAAGEQSGQRRGTVDGAAGGDTDSEAELAEVAAAEEAAAQEAAAAEAQERTENCGAPLFPDDVCPTDEQIVQENQAEALCGPGTAEGRLEAAELGIQC